MLTSEMIRKARKRSRSSEDFVDNSDVMDAIDEAIKRFSKDVNGLTKEAFLTLSPKFWTSTEMAIRLTIAGGSNVLAATDIVITATDRVGVAGSTVASDLQTAIRAAGAASATVTFSTTTWKFALDAIDSTTITLAAPTTIIYADATERIFGKSGAFTATSITGNVPPDCNLETDLPADFLTPLNVEWDRNPLGMATDDLFQSPQLTGDPQVYHIRNGKIRVNPVPARQKMFFINYQYLPTTRGSTMVGFQEFGLASKAAGTETGLSGATTYYFYLAIDGGTMTEYSITTVATTTFTGIIALLNAAITGATFSIHGGDLRCVSDAAGASSDIQIDNGQSGTDMLVTLTGFSAMEAPDYYGADEIDVPDEAEDCILFYTVVVLLEDGGDRDRVNHYMARYIDAKNSYLTMKNNMNLKYRRKEERILAPNYTVNV